MSTIWANLQGKKTYLVSAGMILWALWGWTNSLITPETAQGVIFQALGLAGLRNAIGKK